MRTIYKYPVSPFSDKIQLGRNAVVRHFGRDPMNNLCIWAEVDPDGDQELHTIHIVGTGHPVPNNVTYVMSTLDGEYVWHLFWEDPNV